MTRHDRTPRPDPHWVVWFFWFILACLVVLVAATMLLGLWGLVS